MLDLTGAISGLVLLSPLLVVLGVAVWATLGSPVLFVQERPGRHGRIFRMYKFRTMLNTSGTDGELLPERHRLTRFGKFLRSTSLDELPGLANVLRGDMSLVGPRPLLVEYLPLYTAEQARRHEVRPGITGWAQVNGRNATSWEERLSLDTWYVSNRSFLLDIRILGMTVAKVLRREGVTSVSGEIMPRFRGTNQRGGE